MLAPALSLFREQMCTLCFPLAIVGRLRLHAPTFSLSTCGSFLWTRSTITADLFFSPGMELRCDFPLRRFQKRSWRGICHWRGLFHIPWKSCHGYLEGKLR